MHNYKSYFNHKKSKFKKSKNLLGNLHSDHLKYLPKDINKHLCNINEKPLFPDIKEFDFSSVSKRMKKTFKIEHFDKINNTTIIPDTIYSDEIDKVRYYDELITYYLQCRPKTYIVTCWDRVKSDDITELVKFLKKNGNVYYIRKFEFTDNQLEALILQLYFDAHRISDIKSIKEKIDYTSTSKGKKTIHVIVFDNVNDHKLSGGKSEFKTDMRNIFMKKYGDKFRGDDYIHINDHFCQTVEYAHLYFNKYSRRQLDNFNLERFFSDNFDDSKKKFLTYKNWLIQHTNLKHRINFSLMSGSTYFAHGLRPIRDLDGMYIDVEPKLDYLVKKYFYNYKTKFPFGDIGSENWQKSWIEGNKKWYEVLGVSNLKELMYNPRYHYYFLGVKIFRLEHEVLKKMLTKKKQYPRLLADIYNVNLNTKIVLEKFGDNNEIIKMAKLNGDSFYKEFVLHLENLYKIKL